MSEYVKRISDGKVLRVLDRCGDEICVEEFFPFADGTDKPLKQWHPASRYVSTEHLTNKEAE